MDNITIEGIKYVVMSRKEYDIAIADAKSSEVVYDTPIEQLSNSDLSPTECRFIHIMRFNVRLHDKIIVQSSKMDGVGVSVFRFHTRDIG